MFSYSLSKLYNCTEVVLYEDIRFPGLFEKVHVLIRLVIFGPLDFLVL